MALQTTINHLKQMLGDITTDLTKADGGNKAASQRVRTMTVRLEKLAKVYRKESIAAEKNSKGSGRSAKAKSSGAKAHAGTKKPAAKKASTTTKIKAKPKAKSHASIAKPRAMSLKKPTAKLPSKKRR